MDVAVARRAFVTFVTCAVLVACGDSDVDERSDARDAVASSATSAREVPTTPSAPAAPTTSSASEVSTATTDSSPSSSAPPAGSSSAGPMEASAQTAPPPSTGGGAAPAPRPPQEDTAAPLPPREDTPQGPRTVRVSGPTVENRYPAAPLTFSAAGVICNPFVSGVAPGDAAVAVTIRSVDIIEQDPAGGPVFRVVPVADPAACGIGPEPLDVRSNCAGATLPPSSEPPAAACALGLEFSGTSDHVARIQFGFEATCTDASASPCNSAELEPPAPTPEDPVVVRWTDSSFVVRACPENPPEPGSGGGC